MKIEVRALEAGQEAAWEAFVSQKPNGASFYHRWGWRTVIEKTFGHRSHYLAVFTGTEISGVLPLTEMRSTMFGHFLVSLPFFNYGGVAAKDAVSEQALLDAAAAIASKCGAKHVELRQAVALQNPAWQLRQHKASLTIPLTQATAHWDGLSSRLRGKVRKAEKNEATFEVLGSQGLGPFYELYSRNMRDLGTPVYSSALFENVFSLAPQKATVLLVRKQGQPAAAALALREGSRIELPWICQDYRASSANVNEFLYWKSIEWACQEGAAELDLGRSSIDAGTYRFKTQWNPQITLLNWYYWLAPGVTLPELNPNNPKYAVMVKSWQKLPLPVANRIGPWIVRNIP
ncbi:hypothetical protein F183_A55050 (plasmid) [Bryobacterales bacterium F-183]|nr:hypothetical protein F183_A55050 [Bryobacterales bacterium F-183]